MEQKTNIYGYLHCKAGKKLELRCKKAVYKHFFEEKNSRGSKNAQPGIPYLRFRLAGKKGK